MRPRNHAPDEDARTSRRRDVPTAAFALADRLKQLGVKLGVIDGPWRTQEHPLPRPGREGRDAILTVTNGQTEVMVDTMEHAIDLAGLLNWCGLQQLNPVSELTLPPALRSAPTG